MSLLLDEKGTINSIQEIKGNIHHLSNTPIPADVAMLAAQAQALVVIAELLLAIHGDLATATACDSVKA